MKQLMPYEYVVYMKQKNRFNEYKKQQSRNQQQAPDTDIFE